MSRGSVYFYLKGFQRTLQVTYHYENENEYRNCTEETIPVHVFKNFYVSLYARNIKNSRLRIDISDMTLSTDKKNEPIFEYESEFDISAPKLFKQINFFKNNQITKKEDEHIRKKKRTIMDICKIQENILDKVDYSNVQLSRSLEESHLIVEFIKNQTTTTSELGKRLLNLFDTWLKQTKKQYNEVNKVVGQMRQNIEAYSFNKLEKKIDSVVGKVRKRMVDSRSYIRNFERLTSLIKKSKNKFKEKKDILKNLPELIRNLKNDSRISQYSYVRSELTIYLIFLCITITLCLFSIILKLNKIRKANIIN